jgi:hypothetical protein
MFSENQLCPRLRLSLLLAAQHLVRDENYFFVYLMTLYQMQGRIRIVI